MQRKHLLVAVGILFACITGATAHGGKLHVYPGTPSGSNYIRTKIATCSKWVPAAGPVKYSLVDAAAAEATAAAAAAKPSVKGDLVIWAYLYKNCSLSADVPVPSAGLEVNITLLDGTKPVGNVTLDGLVMTGSCSSGGGTPFYFDPSMDPVDDADNLLWFHNYTVPKNGSAHGNGANDGAVLTSPAGRAVKSVMLVKTASRDAIACCDLELAGPANTDWAASLKGKGKDCDSDMPSEASTVGHNSTKAKAAAANDTAGGSAETATGGATAKSSGSGAVAGVWTAVASAIASAVMLLAVVV